MELITPDKYPFIIAVALIALVTIFGMFLVNRKDEKDFEENLDDPKRETHRPPTDETN